MGQRHKPPEDGIAAVMRVSDKRIRAIKRERQRVFDENGSASNKEKLERANDADKKYTALKDRYFPYRRRHREMDRYFIIATAISSIYSIIFLFISSAYYGTWKDSTFFFTVIAALPLVAPGLEIIRGISAHWHINDEFRNELGQLAGRITLLYGKTFPQDSEAALAE